MPIGHHFVTDFGGQKRCLATRGFPAARCDSGNASAYLIQMVALNLRVRIPCVGLVLDPVVTFDRLDALVRIVWGWLRG